MGRDIFFIIITGLGILVALGLLVVTGIVFFGIRPLLRSARRTVENVENITSTGLDRIVKPMATGTSVGLGVGSILGFITGIGRRGKKKDKK